MAHSAKKPHTWWINGRKWQYFSYNVRAFLWDACHRENKLKIFENSVLRRASGSKKGEMALVKNCIICGIHQIPLGWSGMGGEWGTCMRDYSIQKFGQKFQRLISAYRNFKVTKTCQTKMTTHTNTKNLCPIWFWGLQVNANICKVA
jgi:hypothetical protein